MCRFVFQVFFSYLLHGNLILHKKKIPALSNHERHRNIASSAIYHPSDWFIHLIGMLTKLYTKTKEEHSVLDLLEISADGKISVTEV